LVTGSVVKRITLSLQIVTPYNFSNYIRDSVNVKEFDTFSQASSSENLLPPPIVKIFRTNWLQTAMNLIALLVKRKLLI